MGYIQVKKLLFFVLKKDVHCSSLQFSKSYAGFRKHLNICHSTVNMGTSNDVNMQRHQSDLSEQSSQQDASDMDLDVTSQPSTSHMSKDQAKDMCAAIIAKLQGSGVANNVVLSVVESMEDYVSEVHANLKEQVLSAVLIIPVEVQWKTSSAILSIHSVT